MIRTLLLLGATSDLAERFLFPALGKLLETGRLPKDFRLVGAARTKLDDQRFRDVTGEVLPASMLSYHAVELTEPSSLAAALPDMQGPIAAYLALPTGVLGPTIDSLAQMALPRGSRIAVEKPFGHDLESARELNALLAHTDAGVYRIDHVLGMKTVHNLVAMRRGNPVLEQLWNGASIERVEIAWEETLALEGRAGFYDRAGALKDVLQNHMLQLLSLIAMKLPTAEGELHERKLEVLRSVRTAKASRRARYTKGVLADGREVASYADEDGVDPSRCTETFAEVSLELELPRWQETEFVLRTGKALARRRKLISLSFRRGGELELGVDGPEDVVLRLVGARRWAAAVLAGAPRHPGRHEHAIRGRRGGGAGLAGGRSGACCLGSR